MICQVSESTAPASYHGENAVYWVQSIAPWDTLVLVTGYIFTGDPATQVFVL